jgi:hypothetical protein
MYTLGSSQQSRYKKKNNDLHFRIAAAPTYVQSPDIDVPYVQIGKVFY